MPVAVDEGDENAFPLGVAGVTGTATVSQVGIAERAGVTVRGEQQEKALRRLERRGLAAVFRRGRLGQGASVYRICGRMKC